MKQPLQMIYKSINLQRYVPNEIIKKWEESYEAVSANDS